MSPMVAALEDTDALDALDREVEARAEAVRAERPDWPCQAGCSACCRALARPMEITEAEWARLDAALDALPRPEAEMRRRDLAAWSAGGAPARTCPLLEIETGRCRVYGARPIACRTYGFYVASDGEGRWCQLIASLPGLHRVVLGHEGSVERRLGPTRLTYAEWRERTSDQSQMLDGAQA